jgi:hypothetical protein
MHFALLPRRSGISTYCNGAKASTLNTKNGATVGSFDFLANLATRLVCGSSCSFVFFERSFVRAQVVSFWAGAFAIAVYQRRCPWSFGGGSVGRRSDKSNPVSGLKKS